MIAYQISITLKWEKIIFHETSPLNELFSLPGINSFDSLWLEETKHLLNVLMFMCYFNLNEIKAITNTCTVDTPNHDLDWFGSTHLNLSYRHTKLGYDLDRSGKNPTHMHIYVGWETRFQFNSVTFVGVSTWSNLDPERVNSMYIYACMYACVSVCIYVYL